MNAWKGSKLLSTYSGVLKYFLSAVEKDLLVSSSFLLARSSSWRCWSGRAGASLPAASSNSFISLATSLQWQQRPSAPAPMMVTCNNNPYFIISRKWLLMLISCGSL